MNQRGTRIRGQGRTGDGRGPWDGPRDGHMGDGPEPLDGHRGGDDDWTPADSGAAVTLCTGSPALRDEVAAIAAAAGVRLEISAEPPGSAGRSGAGVLIVGSDRCEGPLPESGGLILVGSPEHAAQLWPAAAGAAAARVCLLPAGAGWLAEYLGRLSLRRSTGLVLGLRGAVGGCGVSTLACLLAVHAARHRTRTLLVDGDRLGGGLDALFGAQDHQGLRWPDLAGVQGTVSPSQLVSALPSAEGISLLSWPETLPAGGADAGAGEGPVGAVLTAARRGFDLIVVDLGTTASLLGGHCDQGLLLVPARYRAVSAARARGVEPGRPPNAVIVRGPCAAGTDPELVADRTGLPLAGYFPQLRGAAAVAEAGEVTTLLIRPAVRRLLRDLLTGARSMPADAPAGAL